MNIVHHETVFSCSITVAGKNQGNTAANFLLIIIMFLLGGQLIKWFNDRQGKRIPTNQVLRIFHQICRAVAHMHKQNPPMIHRDLKVAILNMNKFIIILNLSFMLLFLSYGVFSRSRICY